jgi:hypothetical protein
MRRVFFRHRAPLPPSDRKALPRVRLHAAPAPSGHICTGTGLTLATSAPGLGSPRPHLHRDWAHPGHICTGTGLTPATSSPGLGFSLPHLRRDLRVAALHPATSAPDLTTPRLARTRAASAQGPGHIRRNAFATSAPGLGFSLPHLHRDWAHPWPHLHRDPAAPAATGTTASTRGTCGRSRGGRTAARSSRPAATRLRASGACRPTSETVLSGAARPPLDGQLRRAAGKADSDAQQAAPAAEA